MIAQPSTTSAAAASPVGTPGENRTVQLRRRRPRQWRGWLFVGPFAVVFLAVVVAPIVYAGYLSLYRDQLVGGNHFVGLSNLIDAVEDDKVQSSIGRVCLLLVIQVPIMIVLAGAAALAIDSGRLAGARLYRIGIFLPYAVPGVVATLMWGFMYGDQFGLVHSINSAWGWHLPSLLTSTWVLPAIGNIVTWEYVGYNMLIFYSALRVVPAELYEAAAVDGAGQWRIARSIKLAALRPALAIAVVFSIIGTFQLFYEPHVLQPLAPNAISSYFTPNMYAYNVSFAGQQYNYSAAIALVMGIVTVLVARGFQLLAGRRADA